MEGLPLPETPLNSLIDKHIFITKIEKDVEGKDQHILIRAKVLDIENNQLKVEYTGNDNLMFDGSVEMVSPDTCAKATFDVQEKPVTDIITEELYPDFKNQDLHLGKWQRNQDERD